MKIRIAWILAVAVALALPALAGGGGHKCTKTAQACLDNMAASYRARGWAGLELDKYGTSGGHTVKGVVSGSPAEAAGFRAGDVLVALNGIRFGEENKEALAKAKKGLAPGTSVTYTVARNGAEQKIAVTLAAVPDSVLAAWIGEHILEHTGVKSAEN